MAERGRSSTKSTDKKSRARSRSRVKMTLKKMMKGIGRKSSKSVGDSASMASMPTAASMDVTKKAKSTPKEKTVSLQLVLLLLDPTSRRFELLQLEFDSLKARVEDIITQIPVSVTEDAIKKQIYEGVIGESHVNKGMDVRLVDFCKERQVLVALPKGLNVKECIRLARPILNDGQVLKMLTKGGFDVSAWKKIKESSASSTSSSSAGTKSRGLPTTPETNKKVRIKAGGSPTIIGILVILAVAIQAVSKFMMTPIQVGVYMSPGTTRSKCGISGYLPAPIRNTLSFSCTHSFLEVGTDGTTSLFDEDRELLMLMVGAICDSDDSDCVNGVTMDKDGSVFMGSKRVKQLLVYGDVELTPFPFEIEPKLRVKKYKK